MSRHPIESISMRDVSFWYQADKPVLNQASVEFLPNHLIHLQGSAGSGRSTILKILAGVMNAVEGEILINGQNVNEFSFEEFLPYRLNIGYSFDMGGLINNKTISENLALPLHYHKVYEPAQIDAHVTRLIERFQLESASLLRPSSIPGSKRKAAVVARSLVMEPDVLLLDDPTTGLTGEMKSVLIEEILRLRKLNKARFVFLVSEERAFVRELQRCGLGLQEVAVEERTLALNSRKVA